MLPTTPTAWRALCPFVHDNTGLASDGQHDELAAACELLARRFPVPPDTPRDRERALGFLVRKGYEPELAYDALRRHAA